MGFRDFFSPRPRALDPAESWELVFSEREGGSYFRGNYASYPYTPRRKQDIPCGAIESLQEVVGLESLHELFIIPWAVRSIGLGNRKVTSPNSVLAIGARAVGLWTEKPQPGIKITIPLQEIAAIEDVTILLYGRLSFVPFGQQLTIRYNMVGRDTLEPALLKLRKRLAGPGRRMPKETAEGPELPFKWHNLLRSAQARLDERAPAAFRFCNTVPKRSRHGQQRGELLVLNPYELVYLCEPLESFGQYGEDSFIIPRSRMTAAQATQEGLAVTSNGAHLSVSMAHALSQTAVTWCM